MIESQVGLQCPFRELPCGARQTGMELEYSFGSSAENGSVSKSGNGGDRHIAGQELSFLAP